MEGTLLVVGDEVSAWTLKERVGAVRPRPLSLAEETDDCQCLQDKLLLSVLDAIDGDDYV